MEFIWKDQGGEKRRWEEAGQRSTGEMRIEESRGA